MQYKHIYFPDFLKKLEIGHLADRKTISETQDHPQNCIKILGTPV